MFNVTTVRKGLDKIIAEAEEAKASVVREAEEAKADAAAVQRRRCALLSTTYAWMAEKLAAGRVFPETQLSGTDRSHLPAALRRKWDAEYDNTRWPLSFAELTGPRRSGREERELRSTLTNLDRHADRLRAAREVAAAYEADTISLSAWTKLGLSGSDLNAAVRAGRQAEHP